MNEVNAMHELSHAEVESVAGGMLPLLILGAAILLSGCMSNGGCAHLKANDGFPGRGADGGVP
jgi:hypothetical protein